MIAKRLAYLPYTNQSLNWLLRQIGLVFDLTIGSDERSRARVAINLGLLILGFITFARTEPKQLPRMLFAAVFWLLQTHSFFHGRSSRSMRRSTWQLPLPFGICCSGSPRRVAKTCPGHETH